MPGDKIHVGRPDLLKWDEALRKDYSGRLTAGGDVPRVYRAEPLLDPPPITLADWGCPSLVFTLGAITFQADPRNTTRPLPKMYGTRKNETGRWKDLVADADVTTLVCSQKVQNIETNLSLEYPSLAISASNPPIPDEDTVQWLKNTTAAKDGTTFQFAANNMLISLNHPNGSFSDPWKQTDDVGRFMQALAYIVQKEYNLTLADIRGPSNKNNLQKMVQKLYGRYMAQAFSSNMRVDINQDTPNITFTGAPWIPPASSNTSELTPRSVRSNGLSEMLRRRGNPLPNIPAILTQTGDGGRTRTVQNRGTSSHARLHGRWRNLDKATVTH